MVPQDAELTRRHDEIPAWDDMDAALKPILARQMENCAGFLEHTDHHVGRLLDAIAEILKLNGYATAHVGKCYEVPPRPRAPRRAPSTR